MKTSLSYSGPLRRPADRRIRSVAGTLLLIVAVPLLFGACTRDYPNREAPSLQMDAGATTAHQMSEAATAFLATLSDEQRGLAQFELAEDSSRTGWSNLPAMFVERVGVRLGDMNDSQRRAFHALLRASTSSQGYQKMAGIIRLDEVLHDQASEAKKSGNSRLPQELIDSWTSANYWVSIYGDPGADPQWAWLLSGHHLAGNFTVSDGKTSFTPLFLGAEPNEIKSGLEAGRKILSHEPDRGIELLLSLSEDQLGQALLGEEAPRDILVGPGRKGSLNSLAGLPASDLSAGQRQLLWFLIQEYVSNADHDAGLAQLQRIEQDGLDSLYFGWMGTTGDLSRPFYYRVHGPSILIEYVVEEGVGTESANHVHSIVRDPSNDYGEDWLGRHYQEHHTRVN